MNCRKNFSALVCYGICSVRGVRVGECARGRLSECVAVHVWPVILGVCMAGFSLSAFVVAAARLRLW